ncbi:hypothetical protein BDN72DRAFT_790371 [Pluteus cervinus]|uniref:Uncharacterized protein n=1 Tax=Pluteus cervinus TaxID=181527 RepID=A0ACD3B7Q5_9AGAR|nr:hypothetical protein BDN72DRAFT_790371 [Pluteus cervinus]
MAEVATTEFLAQLEALYPEPAEGALSAWAFVAATAFSASNLPEAVPLVFRYAIRNLKTDGERLLVVRKIKDALFKSGLLSGFPKAINALAQLHTVVPETLRDIVPLRDVSLALDDLETAGQAFFSGTYGETADSVQNFLKEIYPDLERFSTVFGYGYTYSFTEVLSAVETSFTMIAALIASDVPRQISWHLQGALRNGASKEEVRAVRQIAVEVSRKAGVVWKHEIPDILS